MLLHSNSIAFRW